MRKSVAVMVLPLMILVGSALVAVGAGKHVNADLTPNGSSGVSGLVQLTQMPKGGSVLNVRARGLHPGEQYTSFYYESTDCTEPADKLGTFTAGPSGEGGIEGRIDEDVDEVGSVSVRLGTGYGDLQACARTH
jgi:hypothetical protein